MGLISLDDVPDVAALLVECFYGSQMKKPTPKSEASLPPSPPPLRAAPTMPRSPFLPFHVATPARRDPSDEQTSAIPERLVGSPNALHERWRTASRGLQWRLSGRLRRPTLALSMESSLLFALQEESSGLLVGCVELSLRPVDGKLPGEFAVPPLFLSHCEEQLGAYLSNLAVLPEYRGQGLARRLLNAAGVAVPS